MGPLVRHDLAGLVMRDEVSTHTSSNGMASGPANSMVPFNGFATTILARLAARSSEKIG